MLEAVFFILLLLLLFLLLLLLLLLLLPSSFSFSSSYSSSFFLFLSSSSSSFSSSSVFFFFFFSFFWYYSPWWTLASPTIALYCSRSRYSRLQFLTATFFRSSSTASGHHILGFPTRRVPSGSRRVSLLHGSTSCILVSCPSYFILPIFYNLWPAS